MRHVVIVGNGPAAHRLAERLRHHGHAGAITVLGAEARPAYNRTMLSTALRGTLPTRATRLPELPADIDVHLGVTVTHIDRHRHLVHTDAGVVHRYDDLVLATGGRADLPDLPGLLDGDGNLADGATALRTAADCERVMSRVRKPRGAGRLAVLGAGVLGVEAALALAGAGADVTLVHPAPHPMERQLDGAGGSLLAEHLRAAGVALHLGQPAERYERGKLYLPGRKKPLAIHTLMVCTGMRPEAGPAYRAGLPVNRGVLVDDQLRTSDPHIHALGDCAEHDGTVPGFLEPAWEQAETLATLLAGTAPEARYRGTAAVTRLRARAIDAAAIGSVAEVTDPSDDIDLVTLSDQTRGRYAAVALRQQRVAGAVLVGFPQAIASISQLHERGLPAPADRLGLLLGTTTERKGRAELPDHAVVCRCNNVTKRALTAAWHDGARDVAQLAAATRATTGCGTCADDIDRLCGSLRAAHPATDSDYPDDSDMTEQEGAA